MPASPYTRAVGPGVQIAGRFLLVREAGAGGMGTVYAARDQLDGSQVAVKVLRNPSSADVGRFAREAAVLARLAHPSIVRYVAHGATPTGDLYLAMEWLEGETLQDRSSRDPLTVGEALEVVGRVAKALAEAHREGVVHRDIKPGNVMLVGGDPKRPKVLDFGIARTEGVGHTLTVTGTVIGTPHYMAPEQARGIRKLDSRADIYSLGCVLFELLTGRPPFEGNSLVAVLAKIILEDPPTPSDVHPGIPASVDDLVLRMLAKDPECRPPSADALIAELAALGDLEQSLGLRVSAPSAAITSHEQRLLCVVMTTGLAARELSARTLRPGEGSELEGRAREAVAQNGGRLEVLADGSWVATITGRGTPIDHASRAAHCALAMREISPDVSMALVAGSGTVTARLPVGEVIDRGAEVLGSGAEVREGPVPIRLDRVMAGLLGGRFDIGGDDSGLFLRGARPQGDAGQTLLGRPTPCVGRRRELATLDAILEESASEPIARVALVTAPPGGGKSRLCAELLARIRQEDQDLQVIVGHADAVRAGSPFAPLVSAIRTEAGILEGEPLEVRRNKLVARLGRHLEGADLRRVSLFLGEMARVPFPDDESDALGAARRDAMLMGDAMRTAFEDWLSAETEKRPVLMVIEDVHWADLPTIECIDRCVAHLANRPLTVLGLARPEVHEHFPSLWADRDMQEIRLARLTPRASEELVRAALGNEVDATLLARLVERADGNPFYLEELVRSAQAGSTDELPETVVAMAQARLDGLDGESRRVLRAASVFGRVFWRGGVVALLGGDRATGGLDDQLGAIAAREVIAKRGTSAFPGETEWVFRHALLGDAAYSTLTSADRGLGHRLAGEWLERMGEGEPLVLAEHLQRGGLHRRAAVWYWRAAEQALEGNDLEAVAARCEAGLASDPDDDTEGRLLLTRAEALRWRGRYEDALEDAVLAAGQLPMGSVQWFQAVGTATVASGQTGRLKDLARWAKAARAATPPPEALAAQAVCLCRTAAQLMGHGRHAEADELIGLAVAVAARSAAPDALALAWVHTLRASRALHGGDYDSYLDGTEHAIAEFRRAGDARNECNQRVRLGFGYLEVGEPDRAAEVLAPAAVTAKRLGIGLIHGYALQNIGMALARQGRLAEARKTLDETVALGEKLRSEDLVVGSHLYLSEIALAAGDVAEAGRHADCAAEAEHASPPMRVIAQATAARVRVHAGDVTGAREQVGRAVGQLDVLGGMQEGVALVRLAHAEVLYAAGDGPAAREAARQARDDLIGRAAKIVDPERRERFLGRVPDHARTLELAARLLPPPGPEC